MKQTIQYVLYDRKRLTDTTIIPYGTCNTLITAIENRGRNGNDCIIMKQTCHENEGHLLVVKEELEAI